jgi:SPX domain protein involved in polyphosphate accumulation
MQFGKQLALRILTDHNNWKDDYLDYKGLKTVRAPKAVSN